MKKRVSIDGIFLSMISLFFINESIKLNNGKSWLLSPGLFPFIVSFLSLIFSLGLIFLNPENNKTSNIDMKNKRIVLPIVALSFFYLLILNRLNFVVSSIIYLFCFMIILGERDKKILLLISFITPLILKIIFVDLLGVYLP